MWWWAAMSVTWAGPVDEAQQRLDAGWVETAITHLDPHLAHDADAALLRFELAKRLDDPEALRAVLDADTVARLPWSTRDDAHLLLAQRAWEEGQSRVARRHLDWVYPDSEAYPAARLLLGDLEVAAGRDLAAVNLWREAVLLGLPGPGLLRIAEVYERLGRPANAATYLEMIPAQTPSWWQSRPALARDLLAIGAEGEAMGVLVELVAPEVQAGRWFPELPFLRAEAWDQRCRPDEATAIRVRGAVALQPVVEALAAELATPRGPEATWALHFGSDATGRLPQAWYQGFLQGEDVRRIVERLVRIDRELVAVALAGHDRDVAALAARRAITVRGLGSRLQVALAREYARLRPWVEGRAGAAGLLVRAADVASRPPPDARVQRRLQRGRFLGPSACVDPSDEPR